MITVVGLGPGGPPTALGAIVDRAELVVGAPRHLARVPARRALPLRDLREALDAIGGTEGEVVVLASGDPCFFGIVRALAARFGRDRLRVVPSPSSVAVAFARLGLPWDDAVVVSAHGRDPRAAVNACRANPKVAVLTSPSFGPAELAQALGGEPVQLVVAERLGEPDERLVEGAPEQIARGRWREPNVVVCLADGAPGPRGDLWPPRRTPPRWGLPEDAFVHRNGMVTKAEVRALVLARLGPGIGDLVWDVGAGSGSVAVECARLGAAAVAVDRDPEACALIRENARRYGVRVRVVCGEAPGALEGIPAPDAAFVGGGGDALGAILELVAARARRAVVVTLAALERVGMAWEILGRAGLRVDGVLVGAARLRPLGCAHRLEPLNPVFLVVGERP